mmetsp:Transcript_30814/g.44851  ORF Transcript_30814/g.44851 Transcript_30814/m.44851 type:complete len:486 (+) Transcript_30814:99-1556(+)
MMMTSVPMAGLEERVEIYENQRFWVGGGFSKKGLLPTDRCRAYSSFDGSLSFQTLEECSEQLLGKGWHYDDNDNGFLPVIDEDGTTDVEGWSYFSDFSADAIQSPKKAKGLTHFVRRRRLFRMKTFEPEQFLPREVYIQCEYADSNEVEALSAKMLEALSIATLLHQKQNVSDKVALSLKAKLIDSLAIGDDVAPVPEAADALASTRLMHLRKDLDSFAQKQQTRMSIIGTTLNCAESQALSTRQCEISAKYFRKEEREAIATLAVKYLDPEFNLHCANEICTAEECEFYVVSCPNDGCTRKLSRKHLPHHDQMECGYKVISCPLGCSDTFPRNRKDVHLADACSYRIVKCPFAKIGCPTEVKAKDLPDHLEQNSSSHLLLTCNRMMEYENVFRKMNAKIDAVEKENLYLKQQLSASIDKLGTVAAGVRVNEKKCTSLSKDMKHAESYMKTTTKKLNDHETSTRSEFVKLYKHLTIAGVLRGEKK